MRFYLYHTIELWERVMYNAPHPFRSVIHTNRCSLTTTNMNATDDKDKGLSQTNPDPSLGLHRYTENKIGDVPVETNSLKLHRIVPSKEAIMLLKQLITITSSGKNAASLYAPISALLTRASIDLTPDKEEKVLVFVENSTSVFRINPKDSTDKPGLVAFLADRNTALKITEKGSYPQGKFADLGSIDTLSLVRCSS